MNRLIKKYLLALLTVFAISLVLRAAEVVGPAPVVYGTPRLDDDIAVQMQAIKTAYPTLAKPPRLAIMNQPLDEISTRYLVLHDAAASKDRVVARRELDYFEGIIISVEGSKQKTVASTAGVNVPILMYHRTPPDFEQQIVHLVAHGYTGINLGQLVAALNGRMTLPAKPVIITLDDGYSDQLNEIAILRKYHMPATLYVINGGSASNWCIGAGKKDLPGCEGFMNWDQIRGLDREGLITIGSHTINHPDLASLTPAQQQAEIFGGKQQLEAQLGHPVYDFAYPYGAFNNISVQLARQAGFRSAVTTLPGSLHTIDSLFTLTRLRDSLELP